MSRSRKDGRHRGAHTNIQNKEVWSKRCPQVHEHPKQASRSGRGYKAITHRYERRQGKQIIQEQSNEEI